MKALLTLLLLVALTGCTDSFTGSEDAEPAAPQPVEKFRHSGLMDRAMRGGDDTAGKDGDDQLGLVFKISEQGLMERYRILERYELLERYALVERYEYSAAFDGYAISIEDLEGENDFTQLLSAMSEDPDIEWFEPDFAVETVDPNTAGQKIPWSVAAVGAMESSTISGDRQGTVDIDVYVLDTGVSNADLNVTEFIDFTGENETYDDGGHGTHVAGIIGAIDDTRGIVGIAPGARIHSMKVLGADGTADVSVAIAAMDYIIAEKMADPERPMVVNMSLGENVGSSAYTALDEAVAQAVNLGITVIVASGNQGVDASLVTPAHVESAITVGAIDQEGFFAGFSNYGPLVDILAPGVEIVSLKPSNGAGGLVYMTGTSMAAPHVAGGAALYLSNNPTASPAQVRDALLSNGIADVLLTGSTTNLRLWVGNF